MRKPSVTILSLVIALCFAGPALAATSTAKKPPVKLSGKVNKKGTGKVENGAVEIETGDFFFDDTYIRGTKGETVTVTVVNEGDVEHTFTIDSQDIDETIEVGGTITVEVKIPKNGKAAVGYCSFHKGSGMQFAFFSKKGSKASTTSTTSSDDGGDSGGFGY
jgi:plastocyanin